MIIKRIVANVETAEMASVKKFYVDVLGLETLMDMGWIVTLGNGESMPIQITFASEGGGGTQVPDLSIEVDDVDEALKKLQEAGFEPEYGPVDEPWGVRRFYVRDPIGKLVNILAHN